MTEIPTDVVVVGVGTSGEDLSLRLLAAGLDVVGVEPNLIGGECAYWACIPTKMMVRAAGLVAESRRLGSVAGTAHVTPAWGPVAERIRLEASGGWDDSTAVERFAARGGRLVRGWGRLAGPRRVAVGDQTFEASRGVVIATGSRPSIPPIPGLAEIDYWTNHEAVQAEELPESLLILGGGAVGCEFAQVFARFGVDVTIIEGRDRLVPQGEPEASALLTSVFAAEGISVRAGVSVTSVEQRSGRVALRLDDGAMVDADRLLVAVGRSVDTSPLGLESAGVRVANGFIDVDGRMRAADGVWAMGDVTGQAMFTHVAVYQGSIIGDDILGLEPAPADYRALPAVTFTDPEIGSVGLTEAAARESGIDVAVVVKEVGATFRGWLHGPGGAGLIKLIVDRDRGVLVGATAAGPSGGEVVGLLALAIQEGVPVDRLRHMIYAFPTFWGGAGETIGAYGRGLSTVIDPGYDGIEALDAVLA